MPQDDALRMAQVTPISLSLDYCIACQVKGFAQDGVVEAGGTLPWRCPDLQPYSQQQIWAGSPSGRGVSAT